MPKRMTIQFSDDLYEDLVDSVTYGKAKTKAEAIRNAIILYRRILTEVKEGRKLAFTKDGKVVVEVII